MMFIIALLDIFNQFYAVIGPSLNIHVVRNMLHSYFGIYFLANV